MFNVQEKDRIKKKNVQEKDWWKRERESTGFPAGDGRLEMEEYVVEDLSEIDRSDSKSF